jgi:ESS family glutamate:Na+ symporter
MPRRLHDGIRHRRRQDSIGPIPVKRALRKLGQDIRDARRRRRIPVVIMAARASISRTTLNKVEKGDPGSDDRAGELFNILTAILVLAVCVALGDLVNRLLFEKGVLLPGFLTAMFVGIVITNLSDYVDFEIHPVTIDKFGEVALNVFLAMSLMSMKLWSLATAFGPILIVLMAQMLVITLVVVFVVFRVMGRDYDACVISGGFVGLGLGATPVAIANMDALTSRFGPSAKAFLVVPLVGAFFIDILNAVIIKLFIGLMTF